MPPHCPFDSRVISKLPPKDQIPWTRIKDIVEYRKLVDAAKKKAEGESLAEWELRVFQGA
jgi:hypothetical protein